MTGLLQNRSAAGKLLALKLAIYTNRADVLVLALPRGGVGVAFEIAKKLHLPLDICLVRKLGARRHKELAIGAIAPGVIILNQDIIDSLQISPEEINQVIAEEKQELARRERAYRGACPLQKITNRTIILVDDGIATGATLRAAIATLRQEQPASIVVAVPVASASVCEELKTEVEQIICLSKPAELHSISLWYKDFSQTTDAEVCYFLAESEREFKLL
ncbi:MAG: phosphoribosyltransferase [Gomphosphaeria aponina SAG 52.96 = DSM 107014]|uniref:Phosphoribosyltransferase n=1 Tax=Gomphosphaeria aponina SAG 52.96 = DSM 107014 TaxID=1521640 RepID=A0A941GR70_9CHRO|nr:phosphoribosyltransferase [Gomphosphaeria aponina SAG 52.96 = DSM 107014]